MKWEDALDHAYCAVNNIANDNDVDEDEDDDGNGDCNNICDAMKGSTHYYNLR